VAACLTTSPEGAGPRTDSVTTHPGKEDVQLVLLLYDLVIVPKPASVTTRGRPKASRVVVVRLVVQGEPLVVMHGLVVVEFTPVLFHDKAVVVVSQLDEDGASIVCALV
jgi:hypothetical protein